MHLRLSSPGFTLIELLIVLVIVATLSAIAIPAYNDYRQQVRRQEVQAELLSLANRMEARYTGTSGYQRLAGYQFPLDDPLYTIGVTSTASDYRLIATPLGSQRGDGAVYVDSEGNRRHYSLDSASGSFSSW